LDFDLRLQELIAHFHQATTRKTNAFAAQVGSTAGMRARQRCYAGPAKGAAAWLKSYADAGASHLMLRFAGDHERHLEVAARIKRDLGWS